MNKKINFSDFQIIPIFDSISKKELSDEEYFSEKYSNYISNSRLRWIDPERGGQPKLYKNPPKFSSAALSIGSSVHQLLLQPDEFEIAPKMGKPTAKLGALLDKVYELRREGKSIYESIKTASTIVEYYINTIDSKISYILKNGLNYYLKRLEFEKTKVCKEQIYLSSTDYDTVTGCVNACHINKSISNKLHPITLFGQSLPTFNEDALFIEFLITYKDKYVRLPFKLKVDNWTLDSYNKVITLNDLKTTGHPVANFMNAGGSFEKFSYDIQMAVYSRILWLYCQKYYGVTKYQDWSLDTNMLVVQTFPPYYTRSFSVPKSSLKVGWEKFEKLLKQVAYYEIFGYKNTVEFV